MDSIVIYKDYLLFVQGGGGYKDMGLFVYSPKYYVNTAKKLFSFGANTTLHDIQVDFVNRQYVTSTFS